MFLYRLKVLTVLVVGIAVGGLGAGLVGLPGSGVPAARGAQAPGTQGSRGAPAEPAEPLDAGLLLDPGIQKELRLSKGQVQRLQEAAAAAERGHQGTRKQMKQLQEQIAQLQKQLQQLHNKIGADRDRAVRKAAPGILSARAIARLRQIQRQRRGPEQLLKDPRVQRLLNLDDEQMMKIEKAFKESPYAEWGFYTPHALRLDRAVIPGEPVHWMTSEVLLSLPAQDPKVLARVGQVLTDQQKQALRSWIGEPRNAGSWSWLWGKEAGKGR
jgi:hypothetical protein